MGERYPVPPPTCGSCGEPVPYRSRRGVCGVCGVWTHRGCLRQPRSGRNAGRSACAACLYAEPDADFLREDVIDLFELSGPDDPYLAGGMVLMASAHWAGPDEGRVCEITGLPPEEVAWRARNLRRQGVWRDGKVWVDLGDTPEHGVIGLTLALLAGEGLVESR